MTAEAQPVMPQNIEIAVDQNYRYMIDGDNMDKVNRLAEIIVDSRSGLRRAFAAHRLAGLVSMDVNMAGPEDCDIGYIYGLLPLTATDIASRLITEIREGN
jgi:hypothetical protein